MIHIHKLDGCAPTPLAHYLKALGILRLVAEQADPNARMRLVRRGATSRIEYGPAILGYAGPRVPISELQGATAVMRASSRARR